MIPKKLSITERQILANQFRILAKFDDGNNDYEGKAEILEKGYTGEYDSVFSSVIDKEVPFQICQETSEILQMYRVINNCIRSLSQEEQDSLELDRLEFNGFDGNHDPHYHYMKFLVEKMNLWDEYKETNLNSHSQYPLTKYRKMLEYKKVVESHKRYDLTKDDLEKILRLI